MWVKVLAVCATGMMCLSCIFTFSKGAWGGLAVAVVIFAIFLDRRLIALMGVAGVGIATVISQMVSCVLVLICLYRAESSYQLRLSKLTMKGVYLKQIFQVGVPAGIQSTVINFPMCCSSPR